MSDDDRYDELRRRLADSGRASAPPDLAPEVMRRVRSEPRGSRGPGRFLRPAAVLIAAAVLAGAALVGIAHLGNGTAGSAGSAAGFGVQAPRASDQQTEKSAGNALAGHLLVRHVDAARLGPIFAPARVPACPAGSRLRAAVPQARLRQVEDQLYGAAGESIAGADTRDVELHRAPKGQTRIRITCP